MSTEQLATPRDSNTDALYEDGAVAAGELARTESGAHDHLNATAGTNGNKILDGSKIIIGAARSTETGWYSLHLHDALFAISVRPDQKEVVIAEGTGRGRLRHLSISFQNILRFEAVDSPRHLIPGDKPFVPPMVRVLIKHSTRTDFISIHEIGATPLPLSIPFLSQPAEESSVYSDITLKSADDCFKLAQDVVAWVRDVNVSIKGQETSVSEDYQELQSICDDLKFDTPDVQQTLYSSLTALYVSIYLHRTLKRKKLRRAARVLSSFPLDLTIKNKTRESRYLAVDDLYEASKTYHKETGRPIKEAFDAIAYQISMLKKRTMIIKESRDLHFLEKNAPRSMNIIEPNRKIKVRDGSFSGLKLRHGQQLRSVFKSEGVEVHYLPKLDFLSILVQYETEDGRTHNAAFIKKGRHQALKEFLLAHEIGHWFQHIRRGIADRSEKVDCFLSSSGEHTFLEDEADDFGMAILFPPAYLADREILEGRLSVKKLLDEFLAGMKVKPTPKLRRQMYQQIKDHLVKYKEFKKDTAPRDILTIEVKSIKEEAIAGLLSLINKPNDTFYWVRLNEKSEIVDFSNNSLKLFGLAKKQMLETTPLELVVPEEKERMRQRAKYRAEHKRHIYYFTEIQNKRKKSRRQVIVYSFPILNNKGQYVGAMAALKPVDEIKTESFST